LILFAPEDAMRCHLGMLSAILPLALATACTVTVPAPDLRGLTDDTATGEDGVVPDPGSDTAVPDPGKDPGVPDPGGKDETPVDLYVDPGTDTVVIVPQKGGYPCTINAECISGVCNAGFCTCRDVNDCDKGLWCDIGDTAFYGTANCLRPRPNFSGCSTHVQCKSGACSKTFDGSGASYCTQCAEGGTQCDTTSTDNYCCGGMCGPGMCLPDCGVRAPPAPQYNWCPTGCWDQAIEYCSPGGPAKKLGAGQDCQFLNSWCLTNSCLVSYDGKTSACSCDDRVAPCGTGTACFEGKCVGTP